MSRRTRLGLSLALVLTLALESSAAVPPPPGFLQSFDLVSDATGFGGLSAIEMDDDGAQFTALSDRGRFLTGTILRDAEGAITGVTLSAPELLRARGTDPLRAMRADSEGLAIAPDGTAYVSFEGAARVLRYDRLDGPAQNLPVPAAFLRMQKNAALEALAIDAAGRLYTMPEDVADQADYPVFRFDGAVWTHLFDLPREGLFLPVGADFGPDGRLYVLERQFHGLAGFSSRVRALTLGADGTPVVIRTVMESPAGFHDNLEGLSVWQDGLGRIRLTMISDDNFVPWQTAELVEYALPASSGG